MTEAVVIALRERLARETGRARTVPLSNELAAIRRRCAALPVIDKRQPGRDHRIRRARPADLMVIDTSTGFTMLNDESEADRFEAAIEAEPGRLMSTATCLEISIVIEG